jgi:7-cyano-7-deazaguanine synthase
MVVEASNNGQEQVTAVLCSSGVDSAVLVAHEGQDSLVQPVYITAGLAWEKAEQQLAARLLAAPIFMSYVRPLKLLQCPVDDIYPSVHWALRGTPPTYATPDSDVYLVGRNALLLSKVAVYCTLHRIDRIAIGPLAGNPFPDATPEFFSAIARALALGLDHPIDIVTPFAKMKKEDVIRLGHTLGVPWELTLSCMNPVELAHCGRCSKCRERLQAFAAVNLTDPAAYDFRPKDVVSGR